MNDDLYDLIDEFTDMNQKVMTRASWMWKSSNTDEERSLFESLYYIALEKLLDDGQKVIAERNKLEEVFKNDPNDE